MQTRKNELISKLRADGYRFSKFSLSTEGPYTVRDAMWNYKDAVSHIRYVHHLVKNYPLFAENDKAGSFFIQKALGFSFPLLVLDLETTENTQTSFTSCLFFILIIENVCIPLGNLKTKVRTTYHVGAPRLLRFMNPLIAWVLRRNYQALTSTDIPMRERRGELRRWGYQILSDGERCSYEDALFLSKSNLGLPNEQSRKMLSVQLDLRNLSSLNGSQLIGCSDHWGIKVLRQDAKILVFPRICPHEGAALDNALCLKKQMECPWHGRKIEPLAEFDLGKVDRQCVQSQYHLMSVENQNLRIEYLQFGFQKKKFQEVTVCRGA